MVVSGSAAPSITNVQEAGVDEGGIVKQVGDYLIILRRGRLFTVSIADGGLRPVDAINAYPPGADAAGDWYDEMLVSGDWVVVVGYSYGRGGTEINRFRLSPEGRLSFVDAYHLRSNDYYSSRNYASRLVGDELIFYAPLELYWDGDPLSVLPGMRRWTGEADAKFRPIARPEQIYVPQRLRDDPTAEISTLHTLSRCDLTAERMACEGVGVLGSDSRTFYVSTQAVYLWVGQDWYRGAGGQEGLSFVYRLPLGQSAPTAVQVRGQPVDQFSFRENRSAQTLDVFVSSDGGGDAMWRPEVTEGDAALLRLPLGLFGDGSVRASSDLYRELPGADGGSIDRNRWVGDRLLYSLRTYGFDGAAAGTLVAASLDGGVTSIAMPHVVDRIEVMGRDALTVGGSEDVQFTTIELDPGSAVIGDRYVLQSSQEAEERSHAFFYSPDADSPDGSSGVVGLPVMRAADGRSTLFYSIADMLFLRREARRLGPYGRLDSSPGTAVDDACIASCADWYGNARPIFIGNRIFALLGYELVEGAREEETVREIGRISFAPPARGQQR